MCQCNIEELFLVWCVSVIYRSWLCFWFGLVLNIGAGPVSGLVRQCNIQERFLVWFGVIYSSWFFFWFGLSVCYRGACSDLVCQCNT